MEWKPILEYLGWRQVDVKIPMFAKEAEGRTFFASIPDNASGIIPIDIKASKKEQQEIHNYIKEFADYIIIGDLNNKWKLPYQEYPIDYQVIRTKNLKLEKDTRNQISQAKRFGVTVREMKPEDDYWSCVRETSARQNRVGVSENTMNIMRQNFKGLVAEYGGKVIAGCLYSSDIHFVHSASLEDYQKFRPNHLIMDTLIKIANGREINLGNAPKDLVGLRKFKESFGAEIRTFYNKVYAKD